MLLCKNWVELEIFFFMLWETESEKKAKRLSGRLRWNVRIYSQKHVSNLPSQIVLHSHLHFIFCSINTSDTNEKIYKEKFPHFQHDLSAEFAFNYLSLLALFVGWWIFFKIDNQNLFFYAWIISSTSTYAANHNYEGQSVVLWLDKDKELSMTSSNYMLSMNFLLKINSWFDFLWHCLERFGFLFLKLNFTCFLFSFCVFMKNKNLYLSSSATDVTYPTSNVF